MRSAATMEMPIVTSVCRNSSPVSLWKTKICKSAPTAPMAAAPARTPRNQFPLHLRDVVADVRAEQIERLMRKIDVAHEAKDKREAARDEEIEAGKRDPVQNRADERLLAVEQPVKPVRPNADQTPNTIHKTSAAASSASRFRT